MPIFSGENPDTAPVTITSGPDTPIGAAAGSIPRLELRKLVGETVRIRPVVLSTLHYKQEGLTTPLPLNRAGPALALEFA